MPGAKAQTKVIVCPQDGTGNFGSEKFPVCSAGLTRRGAQEFPQIRVGEKSTIFIGNLVSVRDTH